MGGEFARIWSEVTRVVLSDTGHVSAGRGLAGENKKCNSCCTHIRSRLNFDALGQFESGLMAGREIGFLDRSPQIE
jgi:hypothetical protein